MEIVLEYISLECSDETYRKQWGSATGTVIFLLYFVILVSDSEERILKDITLKTFTR